MQKNKTEPYSNKIQYNDYRLPKKTTYCTIVKITNYYDIEPFLGIDDLDILNMKIVQTITQYLKNDEKINKEANDEYSLIVFEDENQQVQKRMKSLNDALNSIMIEGIEIKSLIGVSSCDFDGKFNFAEAKKTAKEVIDKIQMIKR